MPVRYKFLPARAASNLISIVLCCSTVAWPATFVPRLRRYSRDILERAFASRLLAHSPESIHKHRASLDHTPCTPSHDIVMQCHSEGGCGTCLACRGDVAIQPTADGLCTCETVPYATLLLIARPDYGEWRTLLYQSFLSFTPHADASEHPSGATSLRMDRNGSLGGTTRDGLVCDADACPTILRLSPHAPFLFPLTPRARVPFECVCQDKCFPESQCGCPARGRHCTGCVCRCTLRTLR